MAVTVLNRIVVAVGITAVALVGLSAQTYGQPQAQQAQERPRDQKETKQQKADREARQKLDKQQQQAQKREEQQQAKQQKQAQKREAQARQQQQDRNQQQQRQRLAPQDQQVRIEQQRQRLAQYREHLNQQQRLADQQAAQLQRQHRTAQYTFQQQYLSRLRDQQQRIQSQDRYDYGRDPYFYTPPSYRYSRGGRYYETNQYGVDLLRQAVNYGYEEGYRAGTADRQDRWESDYEDSYAYQDANYGYTGFYVERDDYNTYFREGFRRGYEDGYGRSSRYGRFVSGRGTILGAVLATILNFESIR